MKAMKDKYRVNPDGTMDIKRKITSHVGPFETYYEVGEAYFPCMEMDGEEFFKLTLITGLVGGHKIVTRNYLQALMYFLTFGLCGVGYVLDLIMLLTGSYSYYSYEFTDAGRVKKRFYSCPIDDKKKALIETLMGAVCAFMLVKFMYWQLVINVSELLSRLLMSLN